jgi:hypothetical protein
MCVHSFLLDVQSSPITDEWRIDLVAHFQKVVDIAGLSLSDHGIPEDWTTYEVWATAETGTN